MGELVAEGNPGLPVCACERVLVAVPASVCIPLDAAVHVGDLLSLEVGIDPESEAD